MDERLSLEAVENLVTQFSRRLDFLRELVQNSIDAGSSAVDVWMQRVGTEDDGVIEIHVDDFGDGMTESIIDNELTRLFASSKENDLTKIGKFGIGFVSVFAMKPKGVLLHTGRSGEYWEVFFHEDRSFTKTRIDDPIEGTQITLFVEGDGAEYRELVAGAEATLRRWCACSDTEISFEDRSAPDSESRVINEPFVASGLCARTVQYPETEIALAFQEQPVYGFYNKGLALAVSTVGNDVMGAHASRYPHIGFKIKSRWLEHTLSRETVMRDENFEKAMALLREAADGPLHGALVDALVVAAAADPWTLAAASHHRRLLAFLAVEPDELLLADELLERPILRTVHDRVISLGGVVEALERDGRIFVAASPSSLTERLQHGDVPVLLGDRRSTLDDGTSDPVTRLLVRFLAARRTHSLVGKVGRRLGQDPVELARDRVVHPQAVFVRVGLDAPPLRDHERLVEQAHRALRDADLGYQELVIGTVEGEDQDPPLFVLGRRIEELMQRPPRGSYRRGFLERPRALVNRRHPHFVAMLDLHRVDPALAAYCLAKALVLAEDRTKSLECDPMLAAAARGDH
ncbi:ATP-binding protein [Paraliomyxa miuraensis]|uniref:ATP-binding protein n=1 Tax=Paraliomyxa miuraensis TaxID=376150 RepID=UPI002256F23E|nr:ATP-binding protein [Paraliomyxa miuraensis]MCX4240333.1 ATP-binding protein [Paraliomyxa miuraensis]